MRIKIMLITLIGILSAICLINSEEFNFTHYISNSKVIGNTNNIWLEQGDKAPFAGWLIKEPRVKELLAIEMNYSLNSGIAESYKVLLGLADKKVELYKQDANDADKKTQIEVQKNAAYEMKIKSLERSNRIWITTSVVCISVSITIVGGVIIYAILANSQIRR